MLLQGCGTRTIGHGNTNEMETEPQSRRVSGQAVRAEDERRATSVLNQHFAMAIPRDCMQCIYAPLFLVWDTGLMASKGLRKLAACDWVRKRQPDK